MAQQTLTTRASRSPRWALAALALCTLLPSLATSSANVGLPALVSAFGVPFRYAQWVVLSYLLSMTVLVVAAGRLGDLAGRRPMLLVGLAVFTVGSLACGLADGMPALIAARAAQGVGAALLMALTMAFVADAVPQGKTGSAMGLLGTMSAVGTALGPSLGGFLLAGFGWRAIFLANVLPGLVALVLAWRWLPAPGHRAVQGVASKDAGSGRAGGDGGAGRRVANGKNRDGDGVERAVSPAWWADARLVRACAMSCLVMTVMMATLVVGPFHLSAALKLDAARVGLAMSCGPIVSALAGVPGGRLVDRFGAGRAMLAGLATLLAGVTALAAMPLSWGVAGYVLPLVVVTAGYALFQAANNTAVMAGVQPATRGAVSGMLALARNVGLLAGASAMGAVFALGVGSGQVMQAPADAVARGTNLTFAVAAMLVCAALALAAQWRRNG